MHKILIVDDHPFFLHGFSQYLSEARDFEIDSALLSMKPLPRSIMPTRPSLCWM